MASVCEPSEWQMRVTKGRDKIEKGKFHLGLNLKKIVLFSGPKEMTLKKIQLFTVALFVLNTHEVK